jgi:ATP-binding cassette, subfamily C (CFTR/MRP), member 1
MESYVADLSRTNKKTVSKLSDTRMGLIYELIDGIKTLKLTGLGDIITRRISGQRNKELDSAWKGRLLDASNLIISRLVPVIVISLTFGLYLLAGEKLDAPKVFATLSVINIMGRPINVIPKCISLFSGCLVSLKRIEDIIRLGDCDDGQSDNQINQMSTIVSVNHKSLGATQLGAKIELSNVTVPRIKNDNTSTFPLKYINCTLQGPGLHMIAGDNGSGKTTFLQAVLHEVPLSPESVITVAAESEGGSSLDLHPRIAYCGHDPWILRDTVKRNIVLGDPEFVTRGTIDEMRYQSVLDTCYLRQDISQWPHGDMTLVGEKGVTMSGGQKARVSLARALYSCAPILLLDCPLSGLDKEVGHKVFFDAIKKVATQRLVVMVTHQFDLLPHCDHLLVLQNGSLVFSGSFQQLKSSEDTQDILVALRKFESVSKAEDSGTLSNFILSLICLLDPAAQSGEHKQTIEKKTMGALTLPKDAAAGDVGTTNESLWQLYWEYNRACGLSTSFLGVSLCLTAYALSAWSDWMLAYLADGDTRRAQQHFFLLYLFLSALVLCNNISRYVIAAVNGITGSRYLHEALTTSVMSAPLQFFDTIPSGRVISRFSSDMDTIDNAIPSSLSSSYDAFLGVFTGLAVVVIKSPTFLFLIFPLAYQYLYIQRLYRKASVDLKRLDSSAKSPVFSHFNETLSGLEYIRAYQIQFSMIAQHRDSLDRSISARYNWDGVNRWMGIRLDLIGAMIISGAAYSLLLIDTSSANGGGSAGLMVSYAMKSTASLSLAVRTSTALENMLLSLSRVLEYIHIAPELQCVDSTYPLYQLSDEDLGEGDLESLPLLKQGGGDNDFMKRPLHLIGRDISVRYHPSLPTVLKKVSFELTGSKIVGLSGRTGGGKVCFHRLIVLLCFLRAHLPRLSPV